MHCTKYCIYIGSTIEECVKVMCNPMPLCGRGLGVTEFSILRDARADFPRTQRDFLLTTSEYCL